MNKEQLRENINVVICSTICDSLDTPDLDWGVKRRLHAGIQEVIEKYLQEQYEVVKPSCTLAKEIFTARDARDAALRARTYNGFLRNVMEDIEYQTREGLNTMTITKYSTDYKSGYFPRLTQFLQSIGYEVTQTEVPEIRRDSLNKRIKLSIYW